MGQVQMPLRWLLVLWDVDHTLIENNGVNKETYAKAFELLTGQRAEHRAETDGRTEPEIMRNMLVAHGIKPTDDYVARVVEALETATVALTSLTISGLGLGRLADLLVCAVPGLILRTRPGF